MTNIFSKKIKNAIGIDILPSSIHGYIKKMKRYNFLNVKMSLHIHSKMKCSPKLFV